MKKAPAVLFCGAGRKKQHTLIVILDKEKD